MEEINKLAEERDEIHQLHFENEAETEQKMFDEQENLNLEHQRELDNLKCEFGN